MCKYLDYLQEEGRKEGITIGETQKGEQYNKLISFLARDDRLNDLAEAVKSKKAMNDLFKEYRLI